MILTKDKVTRIRRVLDNHNGALPHVFWATHEQLKDLTGEDYAPGNYRIDIRGIKLMSGGDDE